MLVAVQHKIVAVVNTSVEAVHTSEVDYRFVEVGQKFASELDKMVVVQRLEYEQD